MDLVRKTDLKFDLSLLREEAYRLLEKYPFHPVKNQICLTHSALAVDEAERFYEGIGSLWDFDLDDYRRRPDEFVFWNAALKDSYLESVYHQVCRWSPARIGRVRLMLRPPKTCYSVHIDESFRFHIVIETNEDCYFVFPPSTLFTMPADGHLYTFDARKPHTAFNAGGCDRIHLVFDSIDEDSLVRDAGASLQKP